MTQDEINAVKKAAEKMRKQESAQDEIIRFAIQCRLVTTGNRDGLYMDALTEFAKLVAAKAFQNGYEKGIAAFNEAVSLEREACAKIIQTHLDANDDLRAKGSLASVLDYIKFRGEQA